MDDATKARLRDVKTSVRSMLGERAALQAEVVRVATPSRIWQDCTLWDYVLDLPEDAYEKLRIHTYHFTGDGYQRYLEQVEMRKFMADWGALSSAVPEEYRLHEPENGIGFTCEDGRFVSVDVKRFQEVVNAFHTTGLLADLRARARNNVLEIGAGYGGLAYQMSTLVPGTFLIVDLPETILFSASYLAMNRPDARLYLYDALTFEEAIESVDRYDFLFVPNYRLDALRQLRFDLVMNVASLQEMREDQVRLYLEFIRSTLGGGIFQLELRPSPQELGARERKLAPARGV